MIPHAFRGPFSALVLALALAMLFTPDALRPVTTVEDAGVPQAVTLVFFWGVGCPHCEEAKPFVDALEKQEPRLRVERVEVRQDPEGRRRFLETMKQLGATAVGIPTFVIGSAYVVGYSKGETDREVSALVRRALSPKNAAVEPGSPRTINLPFIGTVELSFSGSCFSGSCSTWRRGVACSSIRPRSS